LTDYIFDFFPDNSHTEKEISDWAMENVPAWKFMDSDTRDGILADWRNFVDATPPADEPEAPTIPIHPPPLPPPTPPKPPKGIGARIKGFFKRLFGK
jgi:hypothetical protein